VRNRSKIEVMCRLLDLETKPRGIVFCNTKQMVEDATEALGARGYLADRIHGDIAQNNRERVIKKFRDGSVELLVATDVAARGLDIDDVDVVFNYDLPYDPEDYVHRIGRTGRAGRSGKSITFVYGRDIYRLEAIERYTRQTIRRMRIPSLEEVEGRKTDNAFNAVRERLESGDYKRHDDWVERLLDAGHAPTDIASALFDSLTRVDNSGGEEIAEDREPFSAKPQKTGKPGKGGKYKKGKFKPLRHEKGDKQKSEKRPFKKKGSFDGPKPKKKFAAKKAPKAGEPKRRFKVPK
jgi:ATP-dependent RNA helicase DeaD